MSSPNPYDKIFNDDPISGGNEKRNRLVHGLYDLDYNHYQRPRFRRLLFYASILTVGAAILRKLALNDPVVELMMKQSDDEEERREKVRQSGLNYPVSYDL